MADQKKGGGSRKIGRGRRKSGLKRGFFKRKVTHRRHFFQEPELPRSMWPGEPAKQDLIFALRRA